MFSGTIRPPGRGRVFVSKQFAQETLATGIYDALSAHLNIFVCSPDLRGQPEYAETYVRTRGMWLHSPTLSRDVRRKYSDSLQYAQNGPIFSDKAPDLAGAKMEL